MQDSQGHIAESQSREIPGDGREENSARPAGPPLLRDLGGFFSICHEEWHQEFDFSTSPRYQGVQQLHFHLWLKFNLVYSSPLTGENQQAVWFPYLNYKQEHRNSLTSWVITPAFEQQQNYQKPKEERWTYSSRTSLKPLQQLSRKKFRNFLKFSTFSCSSAATNATENQPCNLLLQQNGDLGKGFNELCSVWPWSSQLGCVTFSGSFSKPADSLLSWLL